mgnify:FL=1
MVNIELENDFFLESFSEGYTLKQKRLNKENKPYTVIVGYYGNLKQALKGYIRHDIKCEDINSIEEVLKRIDELKKFIEERF